MFCHETLSKVKVALIIAGDGWIEAPVRLNCSAVQTNNSDHRVLHTPLSIS